MILAYLWMHGAGVHRSNRCSGTHHRSSWLGCQIPGGISRKLGLATCSTEEIHLRAVFVLVRRLFGNGHTAHRIFQRGACRRSGCRRRATATARTRVGLGLDGMGFSGWMIHSGLSGANALDIQTDGRSLNSVLNPRVKLFMKTDSNPANTTTLTIGRLAHAAGVGVETIRYYQERGLLPVPAAQGAYRRYSASLVGRIRFIKRGQELGLTLAEIGELLHLEDGADRPSIRRIANARLAQINHKIVDLMRMRDVLAHLVDQCEHTKRNFPCPIIATLSDNANV